MNGSPDTPDSAFAPPDPDDARRRREYAALFRITERHGGEDRRIPLEPLDAVRRVADLAAGSRRSGAAEPAVDTADLTAALSLLPRVRADVDALESGLLQMARGRGMTWQEIAFGLGLGSPQAARQRYERLTGRAERTVPADGAAEGGAA
ncbi:DNA-binding protein [Marinactinospora rubrisoli]|uniref:DNA-binding protein n=1 Tax=Marinactinospora rubrisoli TaxID=2715399 RepID=A0ABW2KJV1_9ACTN